MVSHYHTFIPSKALNDLYTNHLPNQFWNHLHHVTLKNRYLLALHSEYPHSKYIDFQLHGGLDLEKAQLEKAMSLYIDDFVNVHWKEIAYKVGERVYAVFEERWYVAVIEEVVIPSQNSTLESKATSSIDSTPTLQVSSTQTSSDLNISSSTENQDLDSRKLSITQNDSNDIFTVKEEPIDAQVKQESSSITTFHQEPSKESYIYKVRFVGYGNQSFLKKTSIKPYVDIPSDYLKPQTPVHAIFYEDQLLYEATINMYLPDTNSVIVKFTGYGNKQDTELHDIRVLTNEAKENWYQYEPYTLEKAQNEVKNDLLERMTLWMKFSTQELPDDLKAEIRNEIDKEIKDRHFLLEKQSDEIISPSESTQYTSIPASEHAEQSNVNREIRGKKRGGKRKREEKEAELAASQWKDWKNKSKKKKSAITEKVAKKASKINETINHIDESFKVNPIQKAIPTSQSSTRSNSQPSDTNLLPKSLNDSHEQQPQKKNLQAPEQAMYSTTTPDVPPSGSKPFYRNMDRNQSFISNQQRTAYPDKQHSHPYNSTNYQRFPYQQRYPETSNRNQAPIHESDRYNYKEHQRWHKSRYGRR